MSQTTPSTTGEIPDQRLVPQAQPVMQRYDYLLYALAVFSWGTSWFAMHLQVGVVAPEVSLFYRFSIGTILMMLWAKLSGQTLSFSLQNHLRLACLGACIFSNNLLMFYNAAFTINSGLLAVVFSMVAVINPLVGSLILKQPIERRIIGAACLGIIGVGLMFGPETLLSHHEGTMRGLGFAGLGVCFFVTGNMISGRIQQSGLSVISANSWGMFYGAAWLGSVALFKGAEFTVDFSVTYLGSLLWLSTISTVMAFFAYLTLLGRIGAARAGYTTVMFPVLALGISTLFENFHWSSLSVLGLVLVLIGNVIALRRVKSAR
jgi:drug/metabolite transporter (DMT)-like permease